MGGRIVDLLSSPHLAAEAMLPWLLNDTLPASERREVEAHLQSCAQCRGELARQREMMALYAATPGEQPPADSAAAFARLLPRLRDDCERPAARASRPERGAQGARWWPLAFALQLGVIAALGAALWLQVTTAARNDTPAVYRGLAGPAQREAGDALVVFDPKASEADMRRALQRAGARIVDGPTATGAYVVRFDRDAAHPALTALQADSAVMRAETLAAEGR